jgi:hypothetical protein
MAFSVNEIKSAVNSVGGLAKSSKFMAYFRKSPKELTNLNQARILSFMCESASIPGIAYQTDDIRSSGYGNIEKRPYATIYQDATLNFFCDNDGIVINFMHKWLQTVFNFNDRISPDAVSNTGLPNNTFEYPSEYYGIIELIQYDDTGKQIFGVSLHEAYPINIGEITVDWNNQDTLTKIPVTFTYTYWNSTALDQGAITQDSFSRSISTSSYQTKIDSNLSDIREQIGTTTPLRRNNTNF